MTWFPIFGITTVILPAVPSEMETEFNAVTSSLVLIINLILIGQKNYIYIFILLFLLFTNALSEPKLEVEVALFCSVPWPSVHHLPCPALLCSVLQMLCFQLCYFLLIHLLRSATSSPIFHGGRSHLLGSLWANPSFFLWRAFRSNPHSQISRKKKGVKKSFFTPGQIRR